MANLKLWERAMIWIGLAVVVLLGLGLMTYNRLVALRQTVAQSWSDVDVQLKQRHDLVPNLVEMVKGYASHERGTLDEVVQARNNAVAATDPAQKAASEAQLTGALRQVFALSEAYPDLKANENFLQLQAQLTQLENQIAASRRFLNNAAAEYNAAIQSIPAVFFAAAAGFKPTEFYQLGDSERAAVNTAPQVQFS